MIEKAKTVLNGLFSRNMKVKESASKGFEGSGDKGKKTTSSQRTLKSS